MAKPILHDKLWKLIEPLIPNNKRRFRYPGRKPVADSAVLTGILFLLKENGKGEKYRIPIALSY